MFDRFVRFAEARKALDQGLFERVLQILEDPLLRQHRHAGDLREQALRGLLVRARRRASDGGLVAALTDVGRVLAVADGFDGARTLQAELQHDLERQAGTARASRELLQEAKRLADQGDLDAAEEVLRTTATNAVLAAEQESLRRFVEGRRAAAAELVTRATASLRDGDAAAARQLVAQARALHQRAVAEPFAERVAAVVAEATARQVDDLTARDELSPACALLFRDGGNLPELERQPVLAEARHRVAHAAREALLRDLRGGRLERAAAVWRTLHPRLAGEAELAAMRSGIEDLCRGLELRERGDVAAAALALGRITGDVRVPAVVALAGELEAEAVAVGEALRGARDAAADGDIARAQQQLCRALERWPFHEGVRHELAILEQTTLDKQQRLESARAQARDGNLRAAAALATDLAGSGPLCDEARAFLADVRARMDVVAAGLDQVRRAVHGRPSGSREGLQHCLSRLDELAKVQNDHPDLQALRGAMQAEIDGLQALDAAVQACAARDAAGVARHVETLRTLRSKLLGGDRLLARELDLLDRVVAQAQVDVAAGRLSAAQKWLDTADAAAIGDAHLRERCAELRAAATDRARGSAAAVQEAREALLRRDVAAAEEAFERARELCADGEAVGRVDRELQDLRAQEASLLEVERLAATDAAAAGRRLQDMPPTPPLLRTRIYDLKQGIARAQGLERGFLLRVDEGGEFLVLRGDSLTIGNVRDGQSDLPILANIAGRHARIVRSMSFHGGMQDRIVAEKGEVTCAGEAVRERRLADGDRVRLGSALELVYRLPSRRSLTAMLWLRGGFQVAGTDRVLLLKDRGRDGRILVGDAKDVHVRVPDAGVEVEVFANRDGQVRVRCDTGGEIDGRPFSGEHPVLAGALVRCGRVSLTLTPWHRA